MKPEIPVRVDIYPDGEIAYVEVPTYSLEPLTPEQARQLFGYLTGKR